VKAFGKGFSILHARDRISLPGNGFRRVMSGHFSTTRNAATSYKSDSSTLSPRMIRGDKVALAHFQCVAAVRAQDKNLIKLFTELDLMNSALRKEILPQKTLPEFLRTYYLTMSYDF